ncbi:glycosyltransferase [Winogradskyella bathintestinalis]|uniref:Glycosyltransferase n=1 Tax=Winogradskyella bathintestinalis TaxID=3035208 RepID=A0ABT7ZRH2_9FLAO|nr:glycosyltransferase [Winogradskyella bathintestinalis]MDN3491587.1 glycosyltransferase [Winogradskyella bathintestinalis]
MKKKLVVLIPHYNDPEGLQKSIGSIDEESQVDVFVIDDGSSLKPNEKELIDSYSNGEIFFNYLEENKGLSYALNTGIEFALKNNYKYTGRLDCRDLFVKNKCTKQLAFLESHKNIKLLGTWAKMVDEHNNQLYILKHPINHKKIKKNMYLNNMFVHPSVIMRTDIFSDLGDYNIKYTKAAQDFELFFRIVKKYETANYPEALLIYEMSLNSISSKRRKLQVKSRINIIKDNFYFGFYPIYGIARSSLLYFLSRETTTKLKSVIKKQ